MTTTQLVTPSSSDATAQRRAAGGALTLQGLSKRYGDVTAVEAVDVAIEPGEFLTLLGPSGSGKTTTLLMIAGFERPSTGDVCVDGSPVTTLPAHKRDIGMVFQHYALFPHMTVAENVAYPLRMRKTPKAEIRKRVEESLELVHLGGYGARRPHELSGGQQQRVALARATVFRPPVLLMDEPLGALDKKLRGDMQREIRRIHRDTGTTCVCVTHDQEEALALSDRIAVMNEGRIEQVGTVREIYDRPQTLFVAQFLGESNVLSGTVSRTFDDGRVEVTLGNGHAIIGSCTVPLSVGDSASVVTRPERLVAGTGTPTGDIATGLGFTIEEAVFLGDRVRCHGHFETGEPCLLMLDAHADTEVLGAGKGVATWRADDAVVLPAPRA
jgi:spermidine/putrescine ABC transporter ATP-binding subunit